MRILVPAVSFSSEISGIQRHALNMVRCLLSRCEITSVDLILAPWQEGLLQSANIEFDDRLTVHIAKVRESALSRNSWYYRELPLAAARLKPDLVHLTYPVPVNARAFKCPIALTLHDLYPYELPENFGFPQVVFNRWILRQCLKSVQSIVCVSEATKLRLSDYLPLRTFEKSIRIYNCVESEEHRKEFSVFECVGDHPFLFCVAQHRRNKNIVLLIEAFDHLLRHDRIAQNTKLLVVGIAGPETVRIRRLIENLDLNDKVLLRHGLPEAELQWCYTNCEALIAPSVTEGFGLPVAEAILAGCRVVCSDIAAFREIGGVNCSFVQLSNPQQDEVLAEAICQALERPRPVPMPLLQFSIEVIADQYVVLYQRMTSKPMHDTHALPDTLALAPSFDVLKIGRSDASRVNE